jgi:hypothetical protein
VASILGSSGFSSGFVSIWEGYVIFVSCLANLYKAVLTQAEVEGSLRVLCVTIAHATAAVNLLKGSEMTKRKRRVSFDGFAIALPKGPVSDARQDYPASGLLLPLDEMPPVIRSAYKKWRRQLTAGRNGPSPEG